MWQIWLIQAQMNPKEQFENIAARWEYYTNCYFLRHSPSVVFPLVLSWDYQKYQYADITKQSHHVSVSYT